MSKMFTFNCQIDQGILIIVKVKNIFLNYFQLEYICRSVRDPSRYFGNLQVVCVGDFLQLRPVPNDLYQDPGLPVFTSPVFKTCMIHKVYLKTVIRQSDEKLVNAINELEKGTPSSETNNLMLYLFRPVPHDTDTTVLYGTTLEVDVHKSVELMKLPVIIKNKFASFK